MPMAPSYSQAKAFIAIMKAALRSILKSPSAVVFTIAFPLVFIFVFGFLGQKDTAFLKVGRLPVTDTTSLVYQGLSRSSGALWLPFERKGAADTALMKGEVDVLLGLEKAPAGEGYQVLAFARASDKDKADLLKALVEREIMLQDPHNKESLPATLHWEPVFITERKGAAIDFVLPGQLGFSLLAASVFGTAFVFFNLRQSLVLKRFFATPVRKEFILLAEGSARMVFQLAGALSIIAIGYFFLGFTLQKGAYTLINMLFLCVLALLVFMSFGFVISGLAKSESTIPPLSNLITLPQFLLAGTFFPVEAFPGWLQIVSKVLPLTYLNHALRQVANEGMGLWEVRWDIAVLLLWGVIGYVFASRTFKWE